MSAEEPGDDDERVDAGVVAGGGAGSISRRPIPCAPMSSSPVTVRMSATVAAEAEAGHDVGQRGRQHEMPEPGSGRGRSCGAVSRATGSTSPTP